MILIGNSKPEDILSGHFTCHMIRTFKQSGLRVLALMVCSLLVNSGCMREDTIYHNRDFKLYADKVFQGPFQSRAVSVDEIISDYRSTYRSPTDRKFIFKFSLNGRDNERGFARNHELVLENGTARQTSDIYVFGAGDPVKQAVD